MLSRQLRSFVLRQRIWANSSYSFCSIKNESKLNTSPQDTKERDEKVDDPFLTESTLNRIIYLIFFSHFLFIDEIKEETSEESIDLSVSKGYTLGNSATFYSCDPTFNLGFKNT